MLDVGCGEGVLTYRWAQRLGDAPVLGLDLEDPKLRAEWETRRRDNLRFATMPPDRLPCDDDEFDLATAIEVLEHVPDPEQTVSEMARVARRHLLVSVPREPLWRALNMARGAYLRDLGNTPGHVNHFTKRGFACTAGAARRDRGGLLAVSVDDDPGLQRRLRCPTSRRPSTRP